MCRLLLYSHDSAGGTLLEYSRTGTVTELFADLADTQLTCLDRK